MEQVHYTRFALVGAALILAAVLVGLSILSFTRYLRPHAKMAFLAWGIAVLMGIGMGVHGFDRYMAHGQRGHELLQVQLMTSRIVLGFFLVPFLFKLYLKWICGELSPEEKAPNQDGIRAWLRGGNLICSLGIACCAWLGFDYSFWGVLVLTIGLLVAYPLFNLVSQSPSTENAHTPGPAGDLSVEREKIFQLLESGKITASESADLLNALGESVKQTTQHSGWASALNHAQKMILAGGVLVLLSFFLPWFSVYPRLEMNQLIQQTQSMMPESSGIPKVSPDFNMVPESLKIHGGDIHHGLGWLVLLLAAGAIALPHLATHMNRRTQWNISIVLLGMGAFVTIYLFAGNLRFVSIGILLALLGYLLVITGFMKQRHETVCGV